MIDQQKREIRKQIRKLKKEYTIEQRKAKSEIIINKIETLPIFKEAEVVMAYWSMDDEVFTPDFILKHCTQKQIILPAVKGDILELKKFESLNDLQKGEQFGINEPVGENYGSPEKIDLIIIPGVAFDSENNRLGRGKAYYDKLLKQTKAFKLGICFDFQMVDKVPTDKYDIKMDKVVSD